MQSRSTSTSGQKLLDLKYLTLSCMCVTVEECNAAFIMYNIMHKSNGKKKHSRRTNTYNCIWLNFLRLQRKVQLLYFSELLLLLLFTLFTTVLLTSASRFLYHALSKLWFLLVESSALKSHSPFSSFTSLEGDSRGKSMPLSSRHTASNTANRHTTRSILSPAVVTSMGATFIANYERKPPPLPDSVTWSIMWSRDRRTASSRCMSEKYF